jgi:hypothetical protein
MATFCICLSATNKLLVDLAAANIDELIHEVSFSRFISGSLVEPDSDGVYAGVMIQTNRIMAAYQVFSEAEQIPPLYG